MAISALKKVIIIVVICSSSAYSSNSYSESSLTVSSALKLFFPLFLSNDFVFIVYYCWVIKFHFYLTEWDCGGNGD